MGLTCGIVGLPNVGKSTIFNALSSASARVDAFPFSTVEPNTGVTVVPDRRLEELARLTGPQKVTPAMVEFVDIAGLVRGASQGEGLGNQFLGHIRNVDALAHVLRCFPAPGVTHLEGSVDPVRDYEIVMVELLLADLESVERRLERDEKMLKVGQKEVMTEIPLLRRLREALQAGRTAATVERADNEALAVFLLTDKPQVLVANVGEAQLKGAGDEVGRVQALGRELGWPVVVICGDLEAEIAGLDREDQRAFLDDLGVEESGLAKLVREAYGALGLITFYTTVGPELRAWPVRAGSRAAEAAGRIHSDMERGFIRAEVLSFDDFVACGAEARARERGLLRSEGRDYPVQDGDVIRFRFHV